MSPKPAFQKLLDLIKEQWWTKTDLTSSADGTAKFRGLLGEYRVTVAKPAGKPVTATFTLTKTGPNRWMIRLP
jgi:hypothetical protein